MEKIEILLIVENAVKELLDNNSVPIDKNTVLLGNGAVLDSMGLVNLIVDLESTLADKEYEVSLTSEKAMSQRNSPFRTIETLTEYIKELIG